MATTFAHPIVSRESRWAAVEAAYSALRMAQILHGDLSEAARQARRLVSRAWMQYECSAFAGLPSKPTVIHRPLAAETLVELDVDVAAMAYHVTILLDGHGSDAAAVDILPEPAGDTSIPYVAFVTLGTLADLESAAAARSDTASADLWSRTHVALDAWRAGFMQAQAEDAA